jgi:HlyD family secretion protein
MNAPDTPAIQEMLEIAEPSRGRRWRWVALALAVIAVAIGILAYRTYFSGPPPSRFQAAAVERGTLTVIVTATGTLQPTDQVDVGSELSGIVKSVEADYNDIVKAGQVLARLDTTRLESQALQSGAALASAQAKVSEAAANEDEMRRRLERAKELYQRKFVSEEALVTAQSAADRAVAASAGARAQVEQARAALAMDRINLSKAVIRSPIGGTVLARKVEPGQTVAATLQAPVLFTLARDLTQMELHVDVDEADVGRVVPAQPAVFTVDAYPGRNFPSSVAEVRNAAKTVSGVVTYETLLSVQNEKLLLRPGMTGTASITVSQVADALLVPNAALRFTPPVPAAQSAQASRSFASRLLPGPPRGAPKAVRTQGDRRQAQVWVMRDGAPAALALTVGATDGRVTQVLAGDLQPGMEVLTDTVAGTK